MCVLLFYIMKCTNGTVPFGIHVLTAKQVLRVKCRDGLEKKRTFEACDVSEID